MPGDYLHNHPEFADLIRIVADERGIDPALVEKDYWIMHCLYGLQRLGLAFQLKGGTSLSKGHQAIERFSEDIDILIEPPPGRNVKTRPNQDKPAHIESAAASSAGKFRALPAAPGSASGASAPEPKGFPPRTKCY